MRVLQSGRILLNEGDLLGLSYSHIDTLLLGMLDLSGMGLHGRDRISSTSGSSSDNPNLLERFVHLFVLRVRWLLVSSHGLPHHDEASQPALLDILFKVESFVSVMTVVTVESTVFVFYPPRR